MATAVETAKEQGEGLPDITVTGLSGLSLKLDRPNQPDGTWQVLQNCDLYIPGSIRKILPPSLIFNAPDAPCQILNFINYWAQPNSIASGGVGVNGPTNRLLIMTDQGHIYDKDTGALWADLSSLYSIPILTVPDLATVPFYYVPFNMRSWMAGTAYAQYDGILKYSQADGNLYVFYVSTAGTSSTVEPQWHVGNVTDGSVVWTSTDKPTSERFQENALLVQVPGYRMAYCVEYRHDPTNASEAYKVAFNTAGIAPPTFPPTVQQVTIAPNQNGLILNAGRGIVYTWYDPHSLHESSPSPFAGPTKITEADASNVIKTIPGSLLPPLISGQYVSYQIYYIAVPMAAAQAALAAGYHDIRFYATKDGGATFYLLTTLLDDEGNVISNSDGGCDINHLIADQAAEGYTDYFPLPTPQSMQASLRVYEGSGPLNLVPDPANFGLASWNAANAGQLVIVPGAAPDGQAAVELPGTNAAQPLSTLRSTPIPIVRGTTYIFQGTIDTTFATAGTFEWDIVSPDFGTLFGSVGVPAGAGAGTGSVTFNVPVTSQYTHIKVRIKTTGAHIPIGSGVFWSDPLMFVGTSIPSTPTNYPTPDSSLIVPAPAVLSQNQPPIATTMALYAGYTFFVEQGTFKIWYSNIGDPQSVGANSYLPLDAEAGVPVMELAAVFDRLIVGKQRSISQVLVDQSGGLSQRTIDPEHGDQAVHSTVGFGSSFVMLLNTGITLLQLGAQLSLVADSDSVQTGFRAEHVIGDPIKPFTDQFDSFFLRTNTIASPCATIDTTQNLYILSALLALPEDQLTVLIATMSHNGPSPWSTVLFNTSESGGFVNLTQISTIKEVLATGSFPNPNTPVMLIGSQSSMYQMFGGTQDGSLQAIAQTWPIPDLKAVPMELRDDVKVFKELWVEGEDINNWQLSWSTDLGNTFNTPIPLQVRNRLNVNGRQIIFKFTHESFTNVTPMLSYMKLMWSGRRKASGNNGY